MSRKFGSAVNSTKTLQLCSCTHFSDLTFLLYCSHNSPKWSEWDGGKIGGAPSWINPKDIPQSGSLRCDVCKRRNVEAGNQNKEGTILRFITQIYSPADSETGNDDAFHRSLYVFCCPHPLCSSSENANDSVVVLRGQLPKENAFYPNNCETIVDESWKKHKSEEWNVNRCIICGQRASGKCPIAEQWFCCKDHQRDYHKALKKAKGTTQDLDLKPYIYKESELVVEEEPMEEKGEYSNSENDFDEINKDSLFKDGEGDKSDELLEQNDLNEMTGAGAGTIDPTTLEFYVRIGRANGDLKSQCLRYCRWPDADADDCDQEHSSGPLWISSEHRPNLESDIPPCQYCGADRMFEFQVMPQMVTFLNSSTGNEETDRSLTEERKRALLAATDIVDQSREEGKEIDLPSGFQERQEELVDKFKASLLQDGKKDEALDFGTIAIFSCTASCKGKNNDEDILGGYRKEFAWRQKPLE